ncbi:isochorismatase family protein [Leptobacterium flavescens]|uniref:Isochorismatase family protein n=1 Tax=Leptobacterium flavescens TaxID=472055 RepID=A0A6P0UQ71_9FLAO|nr:cysteine hydrolase family protein [Leptobacterium flavescens]NER14128.1 isochorismatase family protein [Leptobacterium flavescens]
MSISKSEKPALLLIDVQKGFDDVPYWGGERNNPDAEANMERILELWRSEDLPVFLIKHCSLTPGSPLAKGTTGNDLLDFIDPRENEPVIEKNVNSAFIDTDLYDQLKARQINTLVVVGLTTDHCVSTTTRMAGNFGFNTYLVEDAVATFNKTGTDGTVYSAKLIHDTAIASLKDEFATVVTTDELKEMLN